MDTRTSYWSLIWKIFHLLLYISCTQTWLKPEPNMTRNLPEPDPNLIRSQPEPYMNSTQTWTEADPNMIFFLIRLNRRRPCSRHVENPPFAKRSLVDHDNFLGVLLPPLIRFIHLKTSFVVSYSFNLLLYCNWKFVQKECIKNFKHNV